MGGIASKYDRGVPKAGRETGEAAEFTLKQAIFERRQAIVLDFDALHQQRRLYVEARLTEVAAVDNFNATTAGVINPHMHHNQHHLKRFGDDFFDYEEEEMVDGTGVEGANDGAVALKQLHLRLNNCIASGTEFTAEDTQHYARAGASVAGLGDLLRHSTTSKHCEAFENVSAGAIISGGGGGAVNRSDAVGILFDVGENESDVDVDEDGEGDDDGDSDKNVEDV